MIVFIITSLRIERAELCVHGKSTFTARSRETGKSRPRFQPQHAPAAAGKRLAALPTSFSASPQHAAVTACGEQAKSPEETELVSVAAAISLTFSSPKVGIVPRE